MSASAAASTSAVHPGADATVTVRVTNPTSSAVTGLAVAAPALAQGAGVAVEEISPAAALAPGSSVTATFRVSATGTRWDGRLAFPVSWDGGSATAETPMSALLGPDVRPEAVAADSEELVGEQPPSGPAAAAVDGDPSTFWHTQWKGAQPGFDPVTGHWITLRVPEDEEPGGSVPHVTGLTYLARQDAAMGRARDYRVLASQDGETWSEEPVASGSFAGTAELQRIDLDVSARYLRLVVLNSHSAGTSAPFLVAAEIGLTLDSRPGEEVSPSSEPSEAPTAEPTAPPTASPSPRPGPGTCTPARGHGRGWAKGWSHGKGHGWGGGNGHGWGHGRSRAATCATASPWWSSASAWASFQ